MEHHIVNLGELVYAQYIMHECYTQEKWLTVFKGGRAQSLQKRSFRENPTVS